MKITVPDYYKDFKCIAGACEDTCCAGWQVDVDDNSPQKRDMSIYDNAYDAISESQDVRFALDCARRYFGGKQSADPVWEILSDKPARAITDISNYLKNVND